VRAARVTVCEIPVSGAASVSPRRLGAQVVAENTSFGSARDQWLRLDDWRINKVLGKDRLSSAPTLGQHGRSQCTQPGKSGMRSVLRSA
jgi:hypothetical protein